MSEEDSSDVERFLASHGPFEKPPAFRCGDSIGDWRVLAFLGRGATSEVYRAENAVTRQVGAVKVLTRGDDRALGRFRREVALLAETDCAAFPRFYGAGEHDGHAFLATEILEPAELPSSDSAVARFILGVCAGVAALHARGYVHRDIKPRNVMLRPSTGEPVLIDMGLAKETEESPQAVSDTLSVVDGHAVGVGTAGYSAPEQFYGGKVGVAADVHALGMLANECFGRRPPMAWAEIVRRSTSSAPEQRYATVAAFARAVGRRHWLRRTLVSAALVAVAVAASLPLVRSGRLDAVPEVPDLGTEADAPRQKPAPAEVVADLFALCENKRENGMAKMVIELRGRDISVPGEAVLSKGHRIVIVGPGRLTASISGERGASAELRKNATLINLTMKPYPESSMKYIVSGTSYLNFLNLKHPDSGIDNVWFDDLGGDGHNPMLRFGGPVTYDAAERDVLSFQESASPAL